VNQKLEKLRQSVNTILATLPVSGDPVSGTPTVSDGTVFVSSAPVSGNTVFVAAPASGPSVFAPARTSLAPTNVQYLDAANKNAQYFDSSIPVKIIGVNANSSTQVKLLLFNNVILQANQLRSSRGSASKPNERFEIVVRLVEAYNEALKGGITPGSFDVIWDLF
jgi:hypothetical protein